MPLKKPQLIISSVLVGAMLFASGYTVGAGGFTPSVPWPASTPSVSSRPAPAGGEVLQPTSSTSANPTHFGRGNGKFGFEPGEIDPSRFLAAVVAPNDINTLHLNQLEVSKNKYGTDVNEWDFDINQTDVNQISAQGRHKTASPTGGRRDDELRFIGSKWWAKDPDVGWMIMQSNDSVHWMTAKYFFDGFDYPQAIHRVWYLGEEGGRHKVLFTFDAKFTTRTYPSALDHDTQVTMWFDDQRRLLEMSYALDLGDSRTDVTVKQSEFGKPVNIQPPR